MAKGVKIHWTDEMLWRLRMEFKYAYNKTLAMDLGVSWRSLVRKARELGLEKEEGFLEKRRADISRKAQANRPPNPWKGMKGWSVPGGKAHQFKPGYISPMATNHAVREKARLARLKTIEAEKYRIREGLDQITKLKLRV